MDREILEEVVFKAALHTQELVRNILSDLDVEYEEQINQVQVAKNQILKSFPKELRSMKVKDLVATGWNLESSLHHMISAPGQFGRSKSPIQFRSKTPPHGNSQNSHSHRSQVKGREDALQTMSSNSMVLSAHNNSTYKQQGSASKKTTPRWKC